MNLKKSITFITVLLLSMNLVSCGAYVKNKSMEKMTVENKAIPPDFGKNNETLVCILQGRNSRDRYMKKHIEDHYKGDYVFVLLEDLDNEAYSDVSKFRYVFDYNAGTVWSMDDRPLPTSSYFVYDRQEDEFYYSKVSSGMFGKLIMAYAISLEKVRAANTE